MNSNFVTSLFIVILQIAAFGCSSVSKRDNGSKFNDGSGDIISIAKNTIISRSRRLSCGSQCECNNPEDGDFCCPCGKKPFCWACSAVCYEDGEYVCCNCQDCFPSAARVSLANGKSVTMSELQEGDHVLTVSSVGTLTYSKVVAFMKKQPTKTTKYKSVMTSNDKTIRLSGNHVIFARKTATNKFYPIYADQVSIGDEMLVEENDELLSRNVTSVSSVFIQGVYVPLTMEGNILVDGVLASCYASANHDVAHIAMAPIRWFPKTVEWIFGEDNGSSTYMNIAEHFGRFFPGYVM